MNASSKTVETKDGVETIEVVWAARDLPPGTKITRYDVTVNRVAKSVFTDKPARSVPSSPPAQIPLVTLKDVIGEKANALIIKGQPIQFDPTTSGVIGVYQGLDPAKIREVHKKIGVGSETAERH
jgi:flagella basal body P-ring formation protein FlgA